MAIFKWFKVRNGAAFFAMIDMEIEEASHENSIQEHYQGGGFSSRGYLENVSELGYDDWKAAAKLGLSFGFQQSGKNWKVTINQIQGLSTDTNPTIVAYTAFLGFCEQTNTPVDPTLRARLEDRVFKSWDDRGSWQSLPDFLGSM